MHTNRITRYSRELPRAAVERAYTCYAAIKEAGLLCPLRDELLSMRANRDGSLYDNPDDQSTRNWDAHRLADLLGQSREYVREIVDDMHVSNADAAVLRVFAKYERLAKLEMERANNR